MIIIVCESIFIAPRLLHSSKLYPTMGRCFKTRNNRRLRVFQLQSILNELLAWRSRFLFRLPLHEYLMQCNKRKKKRLLFWRSSEAKTMKTVKSWKPHKLWAKKSFAWFTFSTIYLHFCEGNCCLWNRFFFVIQCLDDKNNNGTKGNSEKFNFKSSEICSCLTDEYIFATSSQSNFTFMIFFIPFKMFNFNREWCPSYIFIFELWRLSGNSWTTGFLWYRKQKLFNFFIIIHKKRLFNVYLYLFQYIW